MDNFFEHLKKLRKVAIVMLLIFTTFYLLLMFLNQNDNQKIAENIEKSNDSIIIAKSENTEKDIEEIKDNIKKVKVKEVISKVSENEEVSKEKKVKENIDLSIKEEIIENSYQSLDTTDDFEKLGIIEIPKIDLNLAIFKGKPYVNVENKEDLMLYGAVTNKQNQKMGRGNYVLASHIISNSNLLFTNINQLEKEDIITLKDSDYTYKYTVYNNFIVSKDETWILNDIKDYNILTLYTCYDDSTKLPENRVVIRAVLTDIN
ncbi:class A sortase [Enterococcus faecalis]|uniref:class A sortase n=1 Tax=Enterococcus faecalis TaxID=1351 RepID=UPI00288E2AD5|nr:sortase [Enterococcus faecalis]MDT2124373.1 sortase [Enterococcus faecalis]